MIRTCTAEPLYPLTGTGTSALLGLRGTLFACLVFTLLCALSAPALAQPDHRHAEVTIRPDNAIVAAVPANWPPQYSLSASGDPQGFAIDVLDHLAKELGYSVIYKVADTFPTAIELLENGQADLIPNSGILNPRLSDNLFTPPVETFRVMVFVRKGNVTLTSIASLHNRTVGVVERNAGLFLLRDRKDLTLTVYPNVREALLGLLSGNVDAVVYPDTVFEALARNHNVLDQITKVGSPLKEVPRGLRFRSDSTGLHQAFSTAVENFVATEAYQDIYKKWYGAPEPFWTTRRVLQVLGGTLIVLVCFFLVWRYRTARSFNRQLTLKQLELTNLNATLEDKVRERTDQLTKEMEERKRSQRDLETFFNQPQTLNMIADFDGKIVHINTAWMDVLHYTEAELRSKPFIDFIHPDDRCSTEAIFQSLIEGKSVDDFENRYLCKCGQDKHLRWSARSDPDRKRVYAFAQDITEQKKAEEKLKLSASVFQSADEGILITDKDGVILDTNAAFTEITGYGREEAIGKTPAILKSGRHSSADYAQMWESLKTDGHWRGELWNRAKDGTLYPEMLTISAVKNQNGQIENFVGLFADITRVKQHEHRLKHLAHYDAVTNLPNRILLADRLTQAMEQARHSKRKLAVAFVDLDGFKSVNDAHGHAAGDQILQELADRLRAVIRTQHTLARFGGDEFVAVIADLQNNRDCIPTLERLLAAVAQPLDIDGYQIALTASIGVTFCPQHEDIDADQLLRQADQAMYQAKLAGKNRFQFFDTHHDHEVAEHFALLESIKQALAENEFELYFQPKVDLAAGTILGSEVLLRWNHPVKGFLSPAGFLPSIENHTVMIDIGNWVLDRALAQMEIWASHGFSMPLSVNVSAHQLMSPDFEETLKTHLSRHPAARPQDLELEILETNTLDDLDRVSDLMTACKKMGVTFALDDFGTGYSSLAYLKRLPVSTLKIDQGFVRDLLDNKKDQDVLKGIVGFGHIFDLDVIAEGVETVEHGALLLELGCPLGQGYAIARPMPAASLPSWCLKWTAQQANARSTYPLEPAAAATL